MYFEEKSSTHLCFRSIIPAIENLPCSSLPACTRCFVKIVVLAFFFLRASDETPQILLFTHEQNVSMVATLLQVPRLHPPELQFLQKLASADCRGNVELSNHTEVVDGFKALPGTIERVLVL